VKALSNASTTRRALSNVKHSGGVRAITLRSSPWVATITFSSFNLQHFEKKKKALVFHFNSCFKLIDGTRFGETSINYINLKVSLQIKNAIS
jgi:hypothetical protein